MEGKKLLKVCDMDFCANKGTIDKIKKTLLKGGFYMSGTYIFIEDVRGDKI